MEQRFKNAEKLMFTVSDTGGSSHSCVYVMGKKHAVTYDFDGRFLFDEDQKIEDRPRFFIHNVVDKTVKVEVFVRHKGNKRLVMLETTNNYEFDSTLEICLNTYVPRPYHKLGINQDGTISWTTGTLVKTDKHQNYYFGNSGGMCGDVIFDQYLRFVGIVVGENEGQIQILISIIVRAKISKGVDLEKERAANFEDMLYTTTEPNSQGHRCCFAVSPTHAVSYGHRSHSTLKAKTTMIIHNVTNPWITMKMMVVEVDPITDYLILKCLGQQRFHAYHRSTKLPHRGMQYLFCGVGNDRTPAWKQGIVSFEHGEEGKFYYGTSQSLRGDSGGFVISTDGALIGMAVGKNKFEFEKDQCMKQHIHAAANHPQLAHIVSQRVFMSLIDEP